MPKPATAARGGSAQDRRRVRRALARQLAPIVLGNAPLVEAMVLALDDDDLEALAAEAIETPEREALAAIHDALADKASGTCSCGHGAMSHLGDDNMGPCTYDMGDDDGVCSCTGFDLAEANSAAADAATFELVVPEAIVGEAIAMIADGVEIRPVGDRGDAVLGEEQMGQMFASFRAHLERFELSLPDEMVPGENLPTPNSSATMPPVEQPSAGGQIAWSADFVPEATLTDDNRAFAPDSVRWRELPLSLAAMLETQEGHDGATVCGRIDSMWREGNMVKAAGVFDSGEFAQEIARMVAEGVLRGVSVDIAIHDYEVGPRSQWFDEDGNWAPQPEAADGDEPSLESILFDQASGEPQVLVVTDAVIGMSTICPFPAFAGATISLAASGAPIWTMQQQAAFRTVQLPETPEALVASAEACFPTENVSTIRPVAPAEPALTASALGLAPVAPPADWFRNPELSELTPITITDDGRIYGHAWAWESCHTAYENECVTAPHSHALYSYFHLGEIECDGGERLAVGKVTLDAPHAGQRLSRVDASAHYDHTGTVAAHVVCGEDEHGGWVSGAISPDLTEEKLRLLRGSVLSGDWRDVSGNLELIALLAVNVPGFPVPRVRAHVEVGDNGDRRVLALVAAGLRPVAVEAVSDETRSRLAELASRAAAGVPPPSLVDVDAVAAKMLRDLAARAEAV